MIKRIRSDQSSFRTVKFKPGFNVILADRTSISSDKDSRNGLGKTTLIEIIHFCLGSSLKKDSVLRTKELKNWTFVLDLTLSRKDFTVYRNTSNPSNVKIEGDFSDWPIQPEFDESEKSCFMKIDDWKKILGFLLFDLPIDVYEKKYVPTFRSLISYFVRRGVGAFQAPFRHYPQQKEWDIQVNNAYLLGLNWEYASEFQRLKDQEKTLRELKRAATEGLLAGYIGTLGELEAERIGLESKIQELEKELSTFKVHPRYTEIEKNANRLTEEIHKITNQLIITQKILNQYQKSLEVEKDVPIEFVKHVYQEAGLWFSDKLTKRIDDVKKFHELILYHNAKNKEIPAMASVYLLSPRSARAMNRGKVPGAYVSDDLFNKIILEWKDTRQGLKAAVERTAKLGVILKGLGYRGIHIGGIHRSFKTVGVILDRMEEIEDNWQEYLNEFENRDGNSYYYFDKRTEPVEKRPVMNRIKEKFADHYPYKILNQAHGYFFDKKAGLSPVYKRIATFFERNNKAWLLKRCLEDPMKVFFLSCQSCGDCSIQHVAFQCPESGCPKHTRNGPCGGSRNGYCEVYPDRLCIWVRAYERLKNANSLTGFLKDTVPPRMWELNKTSSWINFHLGKDHQK